MPETCTMMFEVQDLKVASPATVSRCGMVYMEQQHVGTVNLVRTWASTTLRAMVGLKNSKVVCALIEAHLDPTIEYIRYECKEKVASTNNQGRIFTLVLAQLRRLDRGKRVLLLVVER